MKMTKIVILITVLTLFVSLYAEAPDWEVIPGTQYSMQIYSHVDYLSSSFTNSNPENIVAAFGPEGESDCRAIAFWNQYNQYQIWYMTVISNAEPEDNEQITFKIYDADTDQILDCRESVYFADNTVVGSYDNTFLLTIPYVIDDIYGAYEDSTLVIQTASGILINDEIPVDYLDEFWVVLSMDTEHGILELADDGSFVYSPDPNFWGSDFFYYYATDGEYQTNNAAVEIQVQPVNDPPVIDLPDLGFTFPEDTVYQVDFAEYIDDVDNMNMGLSFSGNEYIQVDIDEYLVTFTPDANFNGIENITFTVNDSTARAIASDIVPVEVTPVNDAPYLAHPIADFEFNEDNIDTHLNLNYSFTDIDEDELQFQVMNNAELNIIIDSLANVTISSFEENWYGAETIIFSAFDGEYTVYDTVNITVLPINDPPQLIMEIPDQELIEDFNDVTLDLNDYFLDVDYDDLHYTANFNNEHVLISIDNNTKILTISSVPDWDGQTQVTITANDSYNLRYTISDAFMINVLGENDSPVILVPLPDVAMQEDDDPLMRDLNYYFADYDNDSLAFSIDYNQLEINAWIDEDVLYFEPVENWFGLSSIMVTAADMYNDISDEFDIEVIPVNDPPYVSQNIADLTIEEGFEPIVYNLYDYFADIDSDSLSFSVNQDVNNSVVIDIMDNIMTISSLPQWSGVVNVTVTAQDDPDRLTVDDTFTINVIPVNDAPYLVSFIDDYNANEDFMTFDIDLNNYFADPEDDLLVYSVDYNVNQIDITVNDNILSISSVFNWFGDAEVTVYASDQVMGNDPAVDVFHVIVQPVNDSPFILDPVDDYNVDEDFSPFNINLDQHFADYDDDLAYSIEYNADMIQASVFSNILTINSLDDVFGDTQLVVTADDGNRDVIADSFWVFIAPVNDQPVIALPDSVQFFQDTQLQIDFSQYIIDVDSPSLTLEVSGDSNVIVEIDGLVVTFTNIENWNGQEVLSFSVSDEEFTVSDNILVIVLPQADVLTILLPDLFAFNEDETLEVDFTPFISNPDDFELNLIPFGNSNVFIDVDMLMVTFGNTLNWNGQETVTFQVENVNGPEFSSDLVDIIVIPVNDPPQVSPIDDQNILEDSGIHMLNLNAYFSDVDGDVLQYSASYDNENISVDIIYPELYFETDLNWFGTTEVVVTAQDDYIRYTVADTFAVIVEPVNDAPYIVTYLNDITKREDFANFNIDFTGNFADIENDELIYSVDYDAEHVSIILNGTTLEVSSVPDWNGITTISITADDQMGRAIVTDSFNLTVNAVNDHPILNVPIEDLYLQEDFATQILDLDDHFSDVDNDLTYYVYANAGEITAAIAQNILELNPISNWYGSTSIEVVANDLQNRAIAVDTFMVYVESVNDAPVIIVPINDLTFDEDTVSDPVDLDTKFFDIDGDDLVYSAQVSDPNGIVNIDGSSMTVTAAENWFGFFDAYITADDQMGRLTVTDTMHVVVMSVNDPPYIITQLPDLEFAEDFEPYSYDLSQNFADIECENLYYNADFNPDHVTVTLNASMMQINSIDNWNGTTQVVIYISDQLCRAVITDTFMVTVNGQNDPPYVSDPIPNQFKDEDFATFSIDLDLHFADLDGDALLYTAVISDTIAEVSVADNMLYISSILNLNGSAEITVTADDQINRLTIDDTFILNINPVNDPPLLLLLPEYSFDEDTTLMLDLVDEGCICDIDNDPEDLTLAATGNSSVIVDINGTIVTFSAENNWFGSEDIIFSLSDETRYVVYDTVTVIVNPVNDSPYFEFDIPDQQIYEGGVFNLIDLNYYITDVDDLDDNLIWNFSGNVDLIVTIDPVTHIAQVMVPDNDYHGIEDITFTVMDSQDETAFDIVNFEVLPVNDAPSIILPIPDQFVEINFAPFDIDLNEHFTDVDGDELSYYVDFNAEEISTDINDTILTISSLINWYGVSEVVVTANDNINRAAVSDTFLVDVTYTITQYLDLGIMWNWISFYVQPDDYSLNNVFSDQLGANVNTVKYQTQSADYYPDLNGWFGDLEYIQDGGGYLVNVNDPVPGFSITGNRIMSDTPIDLIQDWNWIAYYPPAEDSLSSALNTILDNVRTVKNQIQSAEYFPEVGNGVWFGDLQTMNPGIGYKVDMINADQLVYPLYPVVRSTNSQAHCLPDNSPEDWNLMAGTSDNMVLMLSAEYNNEPFTWAEDRAIGVFDTDGICRAHGIWQQCDELDQGFWYFTVVGNNSGIPLYLRLVDENGNETESLDYIVFQADTAVGNPLNPHNAVFFPVDDDNDQIVPVNELAQNYPNPFNPETTISFSLEQNDNVELIVYNLRGEKIKVLLREPRDAGLQSVIWDGSDDKGNKVASGIYFYSIKTSNYSATRKMVMIK